MRVAVCEHMMIIPMLLAALLVVGVALLGIISSGRDAAQSRVPRRLPANADAVVGVPQLLVTAATAATAAPSRRLASGSMELPSQASVRARPRLPGLTRTRPVPAFGPVRRHTPIPRRLSSSAFSDEV
jgi:hypothetical protein